MLFLIGTQLSFLGAGLAFLVLQALPGRSLRRTKTRSIISLFISATIAIFAGSWIIYRSDYLDHPLAVIGIPVIVGSITLAAMLYTSRHTYQRPAPSLPR